VSPLTECQIPNVRSVARMSPLILVLYSHFKDANLKQGHTPSCQDAPLAACSPPGCGETVLLPWGALSYRWSTVRSRGRQGTPSGCLQAGTRSAAAVGTAQSRLPAEGPRHPPLSCACNPAEWAPPAS
jgi:hypothetical protein